MDKFSILFISKLKLVQKLKCGMVRFNIILCSYKVSKAVFFLVTRNICLYFFSSSTIAIPIRLQIFQLHSSSCVLFLSICLVPKHPSSLDPRTSDNFPLLIIKVNNYILILHNHHGFHNHHGLVWWSIRVR